MVSNSHYIEALDRLVLEGREINLDSVALGAGRKRGSIKRGRSSQAALVKLIDDTAAQQRSAQAAPILKSKKPAAKPKTQRLNDTAVRKSELYQKTLQKLVSIQFENHRLRMRIEELESASSA